MSGREKYYRGGVVLRSARTREVGGSNRTEKEWKFVRFFIAS